MKKNLTTVAHVFLAILIVASTEGLLWWWMNNVQAWLSVNNINSWESFGGFVMVMLSAVVTIGAVGILTAWLEDEI